MIYSNLIQNRSEDPITFNYWKYTFGIEKIALNKTLTFVFHGLEENKYKIFRWKLFNKILPTKLYLYKWKIKTDPLCNHCNVIDDYEHFFVKCKYFEQFKTIMAELFKILGYNKEMLTLKNIVIGYKIQHPEFYHINTLITYIAFAMYKVFYISELKTKNVCTLNIFKHLIFMQLSLYKYRQTNIPIPLQVIGRFLHILE